MFQFKASIVLCLLLSSTLSMAQNIEISTAGKKGTDGSNGRDGGNGQNGRNGYFSDRHGQNGSNGSNASNPTSGEDAKDMDVYIQSSSGQVQVKAYPNSGDRDTKIETQKSAPISSKTSISLSATGGKGGDGAKGGNGGSGGDGARGDDATLHFDGENGGNGGSGGNGGQGTAGANGGRGGDITVHVSEKDTHLLMLIGNVNTSGGQGGDGGSNGTGGRGGYGGRGGDSYQWNESYTEYEYVDDGNGNTTTILVEKERTLTRNGGSNGSDGRSGQSGSANVSSGSTGSSGRYTINVDGKSYTSIYNIGIKSFQLEDQNHDGIIEPGEKVTVKNIIVENNGGMPTPSHTPAQIYLGSSGWILSDGGKLDIAKSLAPGESTTLTSSLTFTVKSASPTSHSSRWQANDSVSAHAKMSVVDKTFPKPTSKSVEVTYPLEISRISGPSNIAPGQSAKISWLVKNISNKSYGNLSELKRQIQTQLQIDTNSTTSKGFQILDSNGSPIELSSGYTQNFSKLEPGQSILVQVSLQVNKDAVTYEKIGLNSELKLGQYNSPNKLNSIQADSKLINISHVYNKSAESNVLIVTNDNTKKEEIESWKKSLSKLGYTPDVWDLSYEGHLNLAKSLQSGSDLSKDFAGKTVIILDDSNQKMIAAREQLMGIAREKGMSFYIANSESGTDNKDYLSSILTTNVSSDKYFESTKDFLKAADSILNGPSSARMLGTIKLGKRTSKKDSRIVKAANSLEKSLKKKFPGKRFVVVYDSDGRLRVFESISASENQVTVAATQGSDEHKHSGFIESSSNQLGFLTTLPLKEKLAMIDRHFQGSVTSEIADLLKTAIRAELATEIRSLLETPKCNCSDKFAAALKKISALLEHMKAKKYDPSSKEFEFMNGLLAEAYAEAKEQVSFFENLSMRDTERQLAKLIKYTVVDAYADIYSSSARKQAKKAFLDLGKSLAKTAKSVDGNLVDEYADLKQMSGVTIQKDSDCLGEGSNVMSEAVFESLQAKESSAEYYRSSILNNALKNGSELTK